MPADVAMPVLSEDDEEGIVTAWMVDEGAHVDVHELIATIQVEKVAADVEAPVSGIVRGLVDLNDPVRQGATICTIFDDGEDATAGAIAAPESEPSPEPVRVIASPSARRVAGELGVDLAAVEGSGPEGRITEADVRAAAATEPVGAELTGLRAVIARNMRESVLTTAPVTITTTVDATDSLQDRITARIVRATAMALERHGRLNGTRERDRFIPGGSPNISLAIQTDDGLVAPVVRGPTTRSLEDVVGEMDSLAQRARSKLLSAEDYQGGTFTVTNLGSFGVGAFTPIINLPQIAILGVGEIRVVPGFDEHGDVVPRKEFTLSLTFDHAFVDGAPAAAFLADLRRLLEEA